MAIQLDNYILDFGTLSNILSTLQTHSDQFTAFESEPLLTATDNVKGIVAPLNVTSVQVASVRVTGNCGSLVPVAYGVTFSSPPVVIATIETKLSSSIIATVQDTSTDLTGTSVQLTDVSATGAKNTSQVTIHILAIGQK